MKTLDQLSLTPVQREALADLQRRLSGLFGIQSISLYGSAARGESDVESDIDLLIITEHRLKRSVRHEITDVVFEINLQYDTNFSTLVVDKNSWEYGIFTILPLKEEILREGIDL